MITLKNYIVFTSYDRRIDHYPNPEETYSCSEIIKCTNFSYVHKLIYYASEYIECYDILSEYLEYLENLEHLEYLSAEINSVTSNGYTPLMLTISSYQEKNVELCKRLISLLLSYSSIKLNLLNKYGYTALSLACNPEIVSILIRVCNVNFLNNDGNTALILSAYNFEKIKLLLPYARINIQNKYGCNLLLHLLKYNYDKNIIKYLCQWNVDINLEDNYGNTALIYAIKNGNIEIINLILSKNPNINHRNKLNYSSLKYAVLKSKEKKEYIEIISILLNVDGIDRKDLYDNISLEISQSMHLMDFL